MNHYGSLWGKISSVMRWAGRANVNRSQVGEIGEAGGPEGQAVQMSVMVWVVSWANPGPECQGCRLKDSTQLCFGGENEGCGCNGK